MADLGEIIENFRESGGESVGHGDGGGVPRWKSAKRKGSKKRWNSGGSLGHASSSGLTTEGGQKEVEGWGWNIQQQTNCRRRGGFSVQEDYEAQFYKDYREVAEEYDREFLEKYDDDLNTTLIFAGLFSAVASAFIIDVNSQLRPDPSDEIAALLRVLIYKVDNTTFGRDAPSLPEWTGPPSAMVHVQTILFASLAASLLSAFLAVLGKQWLTRYASIDMRGSAVERCQSRQRKLDGIVTWYFNHVMESLPLMLQGALLLLGCALSRYLWEVDIAVASVILGVTSLGALIYGIAVVAGTAAESCPYQTPISRILCYLWSKLRSTAWLVSAFGIAMPVIKKACVKSRVIRTIAMNAKCYHPWWPLRNIVPFSRDLASGIPGAFSNDVRRLWQSTIRTLVDLPTKTHLLVYGLRDRFRRPSLTAEQRLHQKRIVSDLRCISWTLRTSLEKTVRLSTFKHLVSTPELAHFDPTLVVDCFEIFTSCINVVNRKVVTIQGLEELGSVSSEALFRTFHHLSAVGPTSSVLTHLRQRYNRLIPTNKIDFTDLPFRYTMLMIHALFRGEWNRCYLQWDRPHIEEQILCAQYMAEIARLGHQQMGYRKIPRWILHFALFSLSLDPPSPPPVIAECLVIVGIDLCCDLSDPAIVYLDESERVERISSIITQGLENMVNTADPGFIFSKRKAISTIFPYAICLGQGGQQGMADAISRAVVASDSGRFLWHRIGRYITTLFDKPIPASLNWAITLASPQVPWSGNLHDESTVTRWAAAISTVPYTEEVCQSVVDALLQIAHTDSLRPHIPVEAWAWLKRWPSLLPLSEGPPEGSQGDVARHVRGLRDIGILKSYLFLVLSEWGFLDDSCFIEMQISIREDFCGVGMHVHREDLIRRLEERLDDLEEFSIFIANGDRAQRESEKYRKLRDVLLEVDGDVRNNLVPASSGSTFSCALPLLSL